MCVHTHILYILWSTLTHIHVVFLFKRCIFKKYILKIFIYLFLDRGEGERERNPNMWLPLPRPLLEAWPATQACALTENQTGDALVHRPVLNPLATPARVFKNIYFIDYAITVIPVFPLTPPPTATPITYSNPPLSSCPWFMHVSSLVTPLPILFLSSFCLFCTYQFVLLNPCTFPTPTPTPILSLPTPNW